MVNPKIVYPLRWPVCPECGVHACTMGKFRLPTGDADRLLTPTGETRFGFSCQCCGHSFDLTKRIPEWAEVQWLEPVNG